MTLLTRVSCVAAGIFCVLVAGATPATAAPQAKVKLLKDINPGDDGSSPSRLVRLGDSVYFPAYSADDGSELWKTDGTRAGTQMVLDIVPGAKGSAPRGVFATDRYVFFTVLQPDQSRRLWRTDGTAAGTVPVPGAADLPVYVDLSTAGDLLFFATYPPQSDLPNVWATDGDTAPVEIGTGAPRESASLGDFAYLPLVGPAEGEVSLWRTDGSTAGTTPVKTGLGPNGPIGVTAVGGALYFLGSDTAGLAVWRSDGTAAGTERLADLPYDLGFIQTAALGPRFIFTVGGQLWASDGSFAQQLLDRGVSTLQRDPPGRRAYLASNSRLWSTDGTVDGTRMVSDGPKAPWGFVKAGDTTVFRAAWRDHHGPPVLWQTGRTGTAIIAGRTLDRRRGFDWLTSLGDKVVLAAEDRHHGKELFVVRPG